jgi:DHA2 family multidrug resistance protein-like MFS transporter
MFDDTLETPRVDAKHPAIHPQKATHRDWIGLAVIALPCVLYSMDLTVLNLALPALSAELRPSASQLLWIIDIYGFLVAGALIPMGTLGDRIGRRKLLLIGAAAFGVISVLAAFSTSAPMLIAARALLGLAGATLAPSTLSLIRNMFHDPAQRSVAVAIWISSYSAGAAIGPLVGGLLLEYFWWGSVFLIGVPVMLLLLVLGPVLLPEFRDPDAGSVDLPSAILSLSSVLLLIYGVKHSAEQGLGLIAVLCTGAAVAGGVWFLKRQAALAHPLVDLRLFRVPAFGAALATYTFGTFVAFGVFVFVAQYLQMVLGLSPRSAGLWTVPFAVAFIVGSQLAPRLARRFAPALVVVFGLLVAALGFAAIALVEVESGIALLVAGFVIYSLGLAQVFTLANDLIISVAPPERGGAAAALSETGSELGGALGIAILGSIGTAIYRRELAEKLPPTIPNAAEDAARDTIGAALAVAETLPNPLAAELTRCAREAFTASLQFTSAVAAAITIATAGLAWVAHRRAATPSNAMK